MSALLLRFLRTLAVTSALLASTTHWSGSMAFAGAPITSEQSSSDTAPVDNLEDAQKAVIQIEAVGTFKDIEEGLTTAAGLGSGFIIDADGRAVTNNHVVTGAAFLKVYVDGKEEPINAKVLGVSECADLAVIDLDGKNYPYLGWYAQPIKVGLEVYAAGFPLGDPEYTLTKGIVSKARTSGESDWSSVDHVIQHDAVIDHGNSGGPLITNKGEVVGVNYAGIMDSNQFYSIAADNAQSVIERLLTGVDVDSIGINAQAFLDEENQISGIWVASVASGSPADKTGLLPGDFITSLEGLALAEDGTMATYCEILRSHDATDTLNLEVVRLDTNEVLTGQLNGRELKHSADLQPAPATDDTGTEQATYADWVTIKDDGDRVNVDVPKAWNDVEQKDWERDDTVVGAQLVATTDLESFYEDWGVAGVVVSYSDQLPAEMTVDELLTDLDYSDTCTDGDVESLPDGGLIGSYKVWTDCADAKSQVFVAVLTPKETGSSYTRVEIYVPGDADPAIIDQIIGSLSVAIGGSGTETADAGAADLQYEYVQVEDPAVVAMIPAEYKETTSEAWKASDGAVLGNTFTAAPNIEDFKNTWTTPGFIVKSMTGLTEAYDAADLFDTSLAEYCTYDDRYTEQHTNNGITYDVSYDHYTACDGGTSEYYAAIAQSDPPDHFVYIDLLSTGDADRQAFNELLNSFYVNPDLQSATPTNTTTDATDAVPTSNFTSVTDETGVISLSVPESWSDVKSEPWDLGDGSVGPSLTAAPNIEDFDATWETPGVFAAVSEELAQDLTPEDALDIFEFEDTCTYDDRYEYTTDALAGYYDVWNECEETRGESFIVLAANPVGKQSPLIFLYVNLISEEDTAAFDEILNTIGVAGALESATATEQKALISNPVAVVSTDTLNLRSGPGTNYSKAGVVKQDEALIINGQINDCAWLQVTTPAGAEGWVSGSSQYVTLDGRCADIPAVQAPAPPAGNTAANQNSGKGCLVFQNNINAELTITFTNSGTGKGTTFKVGSKAQQEQCFDPARYTLTVDAPPPWGSFNDSVEITPGLYEAYPINPG